MNLQPGTRPLPDYQLVRRLGVGAFGEVWHAHGPGGLDVALKFVRLDSAVRALELRSLDAMKGIRHPNLVSVFGAWHVESCLILAMELCDCSLQDRLFEVLREGRPGIGLPKLLSWMHDAADGLDALNARQVQHRDVKPANLLLLNSRVKVADFGLAKVLEQTVGSHSGAGTVAYTAPECFKGQLAQQSDQYSLAVTYFHLRTGHPLFEGDHAQMMYAHLESEPDLSKLLPQETKVLAKALAKHPEQRWRDCRTFCAELTEAAQLADKVQARKSQESDANPQEIERPFQQKVDNCDTGDTQIALIDENLARERSLAERRQLKTIPLLVILYAVLGIIIPLYNVEGQLLMTLVVITVGHLLLKWAKPVASVPTEGFSLELIWILIFAGDGALRVFNAYESQRLFKLEPARPDTLKILNAVRRDPADGDRSYYFPYMSAENLARAATESIESNLRRARERAAEQRPDAGEWWFRRVLPGGSAIINVMDIFSYKDARRRIETGGAVQGDCDRVAEYEHRHLFDRNKYGAN